MQKNVIIQWGLVAVLSATLAAVALLLRPDASLARPEASPFFPSPQPTSNATATTLPPTTAAALPGTPADGVPHRLVLVNSDHPWTGGTPQGLCTIAQHISCRNIRLKSLEMRAQAEAVTALQQMADAMAAEGAGELIIVSAYRSVAYQEKLFQNKLQRVIASGTPSVNAEQVASQEVTRPGDSEHHTGYAFDLAGADNSLDSFAGSSQERWILQNGPKYGFVIRYPSDKTEVTGIIHEPWHIRYVGPEAATDMQRQGMCLEEYAGS